MLPPTIKKNFDIYEGKSWQYWIGPLPTNDPGNDRALAELRRVFQSCNKVRECCDRIINGLVAKPFRWSLVNQAGEAQTNAPAEKLITEWLEWADDRAMLTEKAVNPPLWEAVKDLVVGGRGYLRIWMPDRLANNPIEWQRIMLSVVSPGAVQAKYDRDGFLERYTIQLSQGQEVQVLDADGKTVVTAEDETQIYDLGAHWLLFEMRAQAAITEDVIDAQNSINLARTMETRSLIQNGFVERVLLNAQLPGRWVEDLDPANATGAKFEADPDGLQVGAGLTSFVQGNPIYNELGQVTGYTNPQISYRDPAPLTSYTGSVEASTALIYHAMGQAHLLSADSQISGIARQVLRQDAKLKANQYARTITSALESLLTVLLLLFGYTDLRVKVDLRQAIQLVSPEEKAQILQEYNAGLISRATAIAQLGTVEDADAELALIEQEQKAAAAAVERNKLEVEDGTTGNFTRDTVGGAVGGDRDERSPTRGN